MTTDFLKKIVADKQKEIAAAKKRLPEKELCKLALLPRKRRPFLKTLESPGPSGINIIAEIKRASPSKGILSPHLNPTTYAKEYEHGGAAALSVLTDKPHFMGSAEDLKQARKATKLPVLRKDFLISSYQLFESSVMGADAVLLIVRILSKVQLKNYLDICSELHMDALVEINSEKDLDTGINNRNLSSFETNIETTIHMASLLDSHQVAVAASGIQNRKDIEMILESGVWNFLIGESVVKAENPRAFLKSLQGSII
ncbi:MAG: indole-3-glycerol phosphate synthase TrpC [Deltaproteobacteria bacterium]|nr:indole-3-glycerol phosphate synthase TrpC [Deltaproteobacteria bacterium]